MWMESIRLSRVAACCALRRAAAGELPAHARSLRLAVGAAVAGDQPSPSAPTSASSRSTTRSTSPSRAAAFDYICGGRLIFGDGTGWIEDEAEVFGYRFGKRLGRTLRTWMRAIKVLWTEDGAGYSGEDASAPCRALQSGSRCRGRTCRSWWARGTTRPTTPGSCAASPASPTAGCRRSDAGDGRHQLAMLRDFCDEEGTDYNRLGISLIVPATSASAWASCRPGGPRPTTTCWSMPWTSSPSTASGVWSVPPSWLADMGKTLGVQIPRRGTLGFARR